MSQAEPSPSAEGAPAASDPASAAAASVSQASIQSANASAERVASQAKTLRGLFLKLFLRGRSARQMQAGKQPMSIGRRLALALAFYALFGLFALALQGQSVFALSIAMHSMTFVFLLMFVASSAGEVLFNKEEVDILLHRPINPATLLWAKIRVVIEVSLWIAGALNLATFFVGVMASNGSWRYVPVHILSAVLEAMFCAGCVVMVYQLCLRWFGRERLEGLMTTAQVLLALGAVACGQLVPRLTPYISGIIAFTEHSWWIVLLPPAWFAGIDDALAGSGTRNAWILAIAGVLATGVVMWIAFGKLARDYDVGLQRLSEATAARPARRQRRILDRLIDWGPLRWWLRDPVVRASFLLSAAYLARDRDVKLRIYPALGPLLILPIVLFVPTLGREGHEANGFSVSFAGSYLGMVPLLALSLLQYSQQWQAADIFCCAPIAGPAPLGHGARRAVFCFLALPFAIICVLAIWLLQRDSRLLLLLLPGLIALPVLALMPNLGGKGVPLSQPSEDAKSAGRGVIMIGATVFAMILSGIAAWSWMTGWFAWFVLGETIAAVVIYAAMRASIARARWGSLE